MEKSSNKLVDLSVAFAVEILNLVKYLKSPFCWAEKYSLFTQSLKIEKFSRNNEAMIIIY